IANSGLSRTLGVVKTSLVWCGAKPPACSWHTRIQGHDTTIARVLQTRMASPWAVDRRAADLCRAVRHGEAQGGGRGARRGDSLHVASLGKSHGEHPGFA